MPSPCGAERAFDAPIVFRVVSTTLTNTIAGQLPRRERWILLLLDEKHCIADLAHLTQRSKLDVANTLDRFLQSGSIEPLDENLSQWISCAWPAFLLPFRSCVQMGWCLKPSVGAEEGLARGTSSAELPRPRPATGRPFEPQLHAAWPVFQRTRQAFQ